MYIPLNEDRHPERLQSISCKSTVFISVQTCHAMVPPAHRDGTEEVHGCCQRRTVFIWTSLWGWKHGNPKNELCVRHKEIHFATMDCCTPGAGCTCGILKKRGGERPKRMLEHVCGALGPQKKWNKVNQHHLHTFIFQNFAFFNMYLVPLFLLFG